MPLPDTDQWERGISEPTPGFVFRCQVCGGDCEPKWGDYGVGVPGPLLHKFEYRSDCCYAPYSEEVAKDGPLP